MAHTMLHINILFPGPTQLPYKEMEVDHPASCCLQYTGWDLGYEVLFPYKEMEVDHPASKRGYPVLVLSINVKQSSPLYPTQQTSLYDCRCRDAPAAAAEQPERGHGNISIHDKTNGAICLVPL